MMRLIVSERVDRVQRGEHEVAGLGRAQRGVDRLLVAHLADQDHVRVLAQDAAQRALEGRGVLADLALVDDRVAVAVQELDRVLDRDDVLVHRPVDVVDHRRERGRLARAGRAGEQDDPALLLGELRDRPAGRPSSSTDLMSTGIARRTIEIEPRWRKALTRKRPRPSTRVGEVDLVLGVELGELARVVEHLAQRLLGVLGDRRSVPGIGSSSPCRRTSG